MQNVQQEPSGQTSTIPSVGRRGWARSLQLVSLTEINAIWPAEEGYELCPSVLSDEVCGHWWPHEQPSEEGSGQDVFL